MKTRSLALCAVLVSLALGLSYMERWIPLQIIIPLPGVKLGLANIVTLLALWFLGWRKALPVVVVRCVLGSMFGGGLTALAFSLTGGLLALGTMALSRRVSFFSIYGVSILGAAAHNAGQICAAMILLGSGYVAAYLPFLLVVSVFTGLLTGTAAAACFRVLIAAGLRPAFTTQEVPDLCWRFSLK